VSDLVQRLLGPAGHDVDCDECFDRLDAYVERELAGADADALVPGMREHLEACPACAEEHASLRALAAAESSADG
jgi:anti-sigma factor RsiW